MNRDMSKDVVVVLLVLTVLVSVIGLWSVSSTIDGLQINIPEEKQAEPQGMVILGTAEPVANTAGTVSFNYGEYSE